MKLIIAGVESYEVMIQQPGRGEQKEPVSKQKSLKLNLIMHKVIKLNDIRPSVSSCWLDISLLLLPSTLTAVQCCRLQVLQHLSTSITIRLVLITQTTF